MKTLKEILEKIEDKELVAEINTAITTLRTKIETKKDLQIEKLNNTIGELNTNIVDSVSSSALKELGLDEKTSKLLKKVADTNGMKTKEEFLKVYKKEMEEYGLGKVKPENQTKKEEDLINGDKTFEFDEEVNYNGVKTHKVETHEENELSSLFEEVK